MIFGIIIIFTGVKILRQSVAGIMDEADTQLLEDMVETLNKNRVPNWIDLHNLRIIKFGSGLHIDCHLTVPWYLTVKEAHEEVDAIEALIQKKYGNNIELFVHSDYCKPKSCEICTKIDCNVRIKAFIQQIEWNLSNVVDNKKHQIIE
jgi:divalent metal cation (Fe/Co/Zn/Cd) transporter